MHAAEVVIHEVQGDRCCVVLDLLRERIRQPREPAHVHAHGEILTLHVRRGYVLRVRVAFYYLRGGTENLRRAVARLGLSLPSVDLRQHCVVHIRAESILDGVQIHMVSVRRELYAVPYAARYILHE